MKKVGIITIIDKNNYGNRLQNYALSYYCNNVIKIDTYTLNNNWYTNNKNRFLIDLLENIYIHIIRIIKNIIKKIMKKETNIVSSNRRRSFIEFDSNIKYYNKTINAFSNVDGFDYFIVGSDQVWNPNYHRLSDLETLKYVDNKKKISYAASFGISMISKKYTSRIKEIAKFNHISVREDNGKEIIETISKRKDIEVLIDPTMLLTVDEWEKIISKPKEIDLLKKKKYILNYFLGKLSSEEKIKIEQFAKENECEIINLLDTKDPFYNCGPSEFLYLEKNAFLICTDSFHSSVFAILFNRPFIVFDRKSKNGSMNSRIDTLLSKFKIKNRRYNGRGITKENMENDYSEAFIILKEERKKSRNYLEKSLEM